MISTFDTALRELRGTLSQLMESYPGNIHPNHPTHSPVKLLVDLGSDSRRRGLNPFSSQAFACMNYLSEDKRKKKGVVAPGGIGGTGGVGGVYFEVEAYYDYSAPTPHGAASGIPLNKSFPPPTPAPSLSAPNTARSDYPHLHQHRSTTAIRRRHKGTQGVIIDGGHFESLIQACRTHTRERNDVIAMGMRIKVDALASFLLRTEEKKIEAEQRSRKAYKRNSRNMDKERMPETGLPHNAFDSTEGRLDAFIMKYSSPPDIVVIASRAVAGMPFFGYSAQRRSASYATATQQGEDLGPADSMEDATCSSISPLSGVTSQSPLSSLLAVTLSLLRAAGLRAVDSHHLLSRAPTPTPQLSPKDHSDIDAVLSQCFYTGVKYLVLLSNRDRGDIEDKPYNDTHNERDGDKSSPTRQGAQVTHRHFFHEYFASSKSLFLTSSTWIAAILPFDNRFCFYYLDFTAFFYHYYSDMDRGGCVQRSTD